MYLKSKKKGIQFLFLILFFISLVYAREYTQDYNNALTRSITDSLYCLTDGSNCVFGAGGAGDKWIDGGTFIYPNETYATSIVVNNSIKAGDWSNVTINTNQVLNLSGLDDTNCSGADCVIGYGNLTGVPDFYTGEQVNVTIDVLANHTSANATLLEIVGRQIRWLAPLFQEANYYIRSLLYNRTEADSTFTNQTVADKRYLNQTDQRYNETDLIVSSNTTILNYISNNNISILGYISGNNNSVVSYIGSYVLNNNNSVLSHILAQNQAQNISIDYHGSFLTNITTGSCDKVTGINPNGTPICGIDASGGGGGVNESIFFNKTTENWNANLSIAGRTGYDAGNYICDNNFTGTHLCSWTEIARTYDLKNVSQLSDWTGTAWISGGPSKYTGVGVLFVNDCQGFTDGAEATTVAYGNAWDFSNNKGLTGACSSLIPLACCKEVT